jgi:putative peptidoglycan lipid II flippase
MAASGISAVLAFIVQITTARFYGTRAEMDAFLNASTIPTVLFGLFNGAIVAALVPTFSEYMSSDRPEEVQRLGSTVINSLFIIMSTLATLGWLLAPYFVPIFAHGFPRPEQLLVVHMVRWLMPGIVATSISGVCAAQLNANNRFLASSLIMVAANLVTVCFVLVFHRELGIFALVLGTVVGLFAQLLVQAPSIFRFGLYRFELDLRHPGLSKVWALLVPVAVGSGASQINLAFDRFFASTLSAGSTAAMGYTAKLAGLPVQIGAGAIATVIFPLIARQVASADRTGIRQSISLALRMVGFIVFPCAAGLIAFGFPIVQTLFERGAFDPGATALCSSLIPFACVQLVANSNVTVLGRACYAFKEVRIAASISIAAVAINVALSAIWLHSLGARGLLLANGVAGIFAVSLQIGLLRRLTNGFEWKPIALSLGRILLSSIVMAAGGYWLRIHLYSPTQPFAERALELGTSLILAVTIFISSARLFGVKELSVAADALRSKIARRRAII